jgi:hypothetical protein
MTYIVMNNYIYGNDGRAFSPDNANRQEGFNHTITVILLSFATVKLPSAPGANSLHAEPLFIQTIDKLIVKPSTQGFSRGKWMNARPTMSPQSLPFG